MRLTPADIHRRIFSESFKGYNKQEVDDFIDKIARDYEELYRENANLRTKVSELEKRIKEYVEMEQTLKKALIQAQKSREEAMKDAKLKAELIKREAQLKAQQILADAKMQLNQLMKHIQDLKRRKTLLKMELKSVLDSYYQFLNEDFAEKKKTVTKNSSKGVILKANVAK